MPLVFRAVRRLASATFAALVACRTPRSATLHLSPSKIDAALGCYELISPTTRALEPGPLGRFRLRPDSVTPQGRTLRPIELLPNPAWPVELQRGMHTWDIDTLTDTIRVIVSNGFSGQFFRGVRDKRGDIQGIAGFLGDTGPPFEHAIHSTIARRIACSS